MRRFEVYLDKGCVGVEAIEDIVEMPDDATDEECEEACRDLLDTMISNEIDTGWCELPQSKKKAAPAPRKEGTDT